MHRAAQNRLSKQIREVGSDKAARDQLIVEGAKRLIHSKRWSRACANWRRSSKRQLLLVPNIPDASVPDGRDEDDNVEIKRWGEPTRFDFEPLDHVALMQRLDLLDLERGAKVAGSRSYVLKNDAARLELALMLFALDRIGRKGFTQLTVPAMAKEFAFIGNSQFPRGREQVYALAKDELFLVGTAEVSVTGMFANEVLADATCRCAS